MVFYRDIGHLTYLSRIKPKINYIIVIYAVSAYVIKLLEIYSFPIWLPQHKKCTQQTFQLQKFLF